MRINCPHCGQRDLYEFSYQGDAQNELGRPAPSLENSDGWNAYVYDRINPAGDHQELWQHTGGCRRFLKVTRNTVSHEIKGAEFVR